MSDTISDFLTIIRNANRARKDTCTAPYSKMKMRIAEIMKGEGFIRNCAEGKDERGHPSIIITMKYVDEKTAISDIQRWSKPGRRLYYQHDDIPKVLGGLGLGIMTTSKGVIKDRDARREKVGGELICAVW